MRERTLKKYLRVVGRLFLKKGRIIMSLIFGERCMMCKSTEVEHDLETGKRICAKCKNPFPEPPTPSYESF